MPAWFRAESNTRNCGESPVSVMAEAHLGATPAEPGSPAAGAAPILRSLRGVLKNADIDAYRKHLAAKYR